MRQVIKPVLFTLAATAALNSYAGSPNASCTAGTQAIGVVGQVKVSKEGISRGGARFAFDLYDEKEDRSYLISSMTGYGLDTAVGRAVFDTLREAGERGEKVAVSCVSTDSADNVAIYYDRSL
jgi:hypothetical protein